MRSYVASETSSSLRPRSCTISPSTRRRSVPIKSGMISGACVCVRCSACTSNKSPPSTLTAFPQAKREVGTPRRSMPSSTTSSCSSVAEWTSSATTASSRAAGVMRPKQAALSISAIGRMRLPPRVTRCRAASVAGASPSSTEASSARSIQLRSSASRSWTDAMRSVTRGSVPCASAARPRISAAAAAGMSGTSSSF